MSETQNPQYRKSFELLSKILSASIVANVLMVELSGSKSLSQIESGLSFIYVLMQEQGVSLEQTSLFLLSVPLSLCIYLGTKRGRDEATPDP